MNDVKTVDSLCPTCGNTVPAESRSAFCSGPCATRFQRIAAYADKCADKPNEGAWHSPWKISTGEGTRTMGAGEYYLALLNALRALKIGERVPDWLLKAIKAGPSPALFPHEAHRAVRDAAERRGVFVSLGLGHPRYALVSFADMEKERADFVAMEQLGKEPVKLQSAERSLVWNRRKLETIAKSRAIIAADHKAALTSEAHRKACEAELAEATKNGDAVGQEWARRQLDMIAEAIAPPSKQNPRPR